MSAPKVIFAVLATDKEPWSVMHRAIKQTWARDSDSVFFLFGGAPVLSCVGQDLFLPVPDVNCMMKSTAAFRYLLATRQFDYVCRCCDGSYLDVPRLTRLLENKPRERLYAGVELSYGGVSYASGSGYIVSRDCAQLLADSENEIAELMRCYGEVSYVGRYIEDVVIGDFFAQHGVELDNTRAGYEDTDFMNASAYHYHFRTDPELMKRIHDMKTEKKENA